MFEFKSISEKPPRSVSLLSGLKYSSILDKSIIFPLVFIVLFMGGFPIAIFLTMEKSFRLPFIEMEKADGNVTEIVDDSKCNENKVSIHYQFITEGNRIYYGKYTLYQDNIYSNLVVGDILPIEYDPNDPSFNGIEGEIGKDNPPFFLFIIFPLFFLLIFAPMLLPNIKQIKDARFIFKKGIITKGEILFVGRKKLSNVFNFKMLTNLEVFYCFKTLNGETVETKVTTDNDWLANKFEFGSSVTVSYIEKKPKKSIVLDFYYK